MIIEYEIDVETDPRGVAREIYAAEMWPAFRRQAFSFPALALIIAACAIWLDSRNADWVPALAACAGAAAALALTVWAHRPAFMKASVAMYAASAAAIGRKMRIEIGNGRVLIDGDHMHHEATFEACGDFHIGPAYVRFIAGGTVVYFRKALLDENALAALRDIAKGFGAPSLFASSVKGRVVGPST